MSGNENGRAVGYLELLRENRNFRRLWVGQLISQTGDWFNSVALFTLLLNLTGSGESIGYVLILKLLPTFFVGPLAGVVADRYDRKTIMVLADVVRGASVLGFLVVSRPDQVWIIYVLTALQVVLSTFFEPAKSAAIPSIVSRNELVSSNALSGAAWSVTLALGAALGGVVTDLFGQSAAFIIDSATFFISAIFISLVRFPARSARREGESGGEMKSKLSLARATGMTDLIEGARYLRSSPRVLAFLLVKSGWGLGGGVLLLLTVFGKQIFPLGRDGSASIGLLYAARGTGAMIGPIIARSIAGDSPRVMRRAIGVAFFVSAAFYFLFAEAPALLIAAVCVIGAHAGGSIQWVFSTTLLQTAVPDRFLGRVFALELAAVTLTMSLSTYATGWGLDYVGFSARSMAMLLGASFLLPGVVWMAFQPWLDRTDGGAIKHSQPILDPEPATESSFPPV